MDYCPNCGSRLEEGDRFCAECGYNLQQYAQELGKDTFFEKSGKKRKNITLILIILALVLVFFIGLWLILRFAAPGIFPLAIKLGDKQLKIMIPGMSTHEEDVGVSFEATMTAMALETGAYIEKGLPDTTVLVEPMASEVPPGSERAPEKEELVYVFYECDEERVKSGDEIAIYYGWAALERTQLDDYFRTVDYQIRINGEQVPIIWDGYGEIKEDEEEGYFVQKYWMYIGQLDPGEYVIETTVILKEAVFDGWDWFGPGESSGECLLIVE
jgi:predicted nucleic acid-binding Zn ribbon protein